MIKALVKQLMKSAISSLLSTAGLVVAFSGCSLDLEVAPDPSLASPRPLPIATPAARPTPPASTTPLPTSTPTSTPTPTPSGSATPSPPPPLDQTAPSLGLSTTAPHPFNSISFIVTATFSESVTGFTLADINVTNGTASNLNNSGDGATYTFTVTPSAQGLVTVAVSAGVAQDAAGNGNTAATSLARTYDSLAPTVTISSAAASATKVSPIPFSVTFSESVTDFDSSDVTVANGTITGFTGSGVNYSFNVTPTLNGSVTLDINGGVAHDSAGNGNTAAVQVSRTYDSMQPTVTLASVAPEPFSSSPFPVTATFSESVTGFSLSDVIVTNGSASNLSVSGSVYTFTITPSGPGPITLAMGASVAQDAAGNDSLAAVTLTRTYDPSRPSAAIASVAANPTNVSPIPFTVTFSEDVTGFEANDVTVGNGALSGFSGSGSTYSFNVTPTSQGPVTIALADGVAQSLASGSSSTAAAQVSRVFDSVSPTLTLTSLAGDPVNAAFEVTATFSEPVTGFTLSDIDVTNGTASNLNSSGDGATYSFTITPSAQAVVTVAIGAGAAQDAAGNPSVAATSLTRTFDNQGPSVTLSSSAPTWVNSGDITVNAVFNESVTGFTAADLTLVNATVSNFSGSGTTYSFDLHPLSEGAFGIQVVNGAAQDAALNSSLASSSLSRTLDSTAPTVSLATAASDPTNSSSIVVTATFSEAVNGFDIADLDPTNASISQFNGSGTTYTFELSPLSTGLFGVAIDASAFEDGAGNLNPSTASLSRTFDNVRPTVTLSSASPSSTNATTISVSVAFSDNVTGFAQGDLSLANASVSNFSGSGATYSFDLSPLAPGAFSVQVANAAAQDTALNTSLASNILSFTYDNTAPTVSLSSVDGAYSKNSPFTVNVSFNENVTGFTASDLSVTNGSAGNLQTVSAQQYIVDITPTGQGDVSIDLTSGKATDAAGNGNSAASQLVVHFDSVAPTVTISSSAASTTNTSPIPFTITFSETVTGFGLADISVTGGGTKQNFVAVSSTVYTFDFAPSGDGVKTVDVAAGVATDSAGNGNSSATSFSRTFEGTAPTLAITSPVSGGYITQSSNSTSFTVSGTCSESSQAVTIQVDGSVSGFGATCNGTNFSASIDTTGLLEGNHTLTATISDVAGNSTTSTSITVTKDTVAPTITISSPSDSTVAASSGTVTFTLTYSGASSISLTAAQVTLNTTGSSTCTKAVSGTGTPTRTVTLSNCSGVGGTVGISVAADTATDAAGNSGLASDPSSTVGVTASAASQLAFNVQPSSTVAGEAISPSLVVRVLDADGNLVTSAANSITLAIQTNPSSGTLSGTKTVSAVNGEATFSGLSIDKAGNGYVLQATSSGLSSASSAAFTIAAASASQLVFVTQPSNSSVDTAFSPAIRVAVQDAFGNTVTSSTASVALALAANPGSATLTGTDSVNATSGIATFSSLSLNQAASGYTLTATSSGLTSATSCSFNVSPGGLNLEVPIELMDLTSLSSTTAATASAATQTQLDTTAYDGTVSYTFEIVATNTDSAARTVELIDAASATKASLSLANGTSTAKRISTTFTPTAGLSTYRLMLPATTSASQLVVRSARILVKQVGATKTRIYIPLHVGSSAVSTPSYNSSSPSGTFWQRDSSAFATIAASNTWIFEANLEANVSGRTAYAALFNRTTNTQVAGSEVSLTDTNTTNVSASFADSAAGMTGSDGQEFDARVKISDTSGGAMVTISKAALWLNLTNLSKAEVYYRLTKSLSTGANATASGLESRISYSPSSFSHPIASFESIGLKAGSAAENCALELRTSGVSDSATDGTTVARSRIDYASTSWTRVRSSPLPITNDSDRYFAFGECILSSNSMSTKQSLLAVRAGQVALPLLSYDGAPGTTVTAGAPVNISPTLFDANGDSATCSIKAGGSSLPAGLSLDASTCVISGTLTNTIGPKAFTVVATNSAGMSGDAPVSIAVNAANPSQLTLSGPASVIPGTCSTAYKISALDQYGNPSALTADTTVNLSGAGSGAFYSDSQCTISITNQTLPAGATYGIFYYKTAANASMTFQAQASGLNAATLAVTSGSAVPTRLALSGTTVNPVGTCTAITITVKDSAGAAVNVTSDTTVSLGAGGQSKFSSEADCSNTIVSTVIASGTNSKPVYIIDAALESLIVSAQASGLTTGTLTLSHTSTATRLVFSSAPASATSGTCAGPFVVTSVDNYTNTVAVTTSTLVNLAVSGGSGTFYSTSSCSSSLTSTTLTSGTSSFSVYLKGSGVGSLALSATASGQVLLPASTSHLVLAGTLTKLTLAGTSSLVSGGCYAYQINGTDSAGNSVNVTSDTTVTLTGQGNGGFYTDSGCTSSAGGSVTLSNGTSSKTVYFKDATAESLTLQASSNELTNGTLAATVLAGKLAVWGNGAAPTTSVAAASCTAFTIVNQNASGTATSVGGSAVTVSISVTGGAKLYSASNCTGAQTSSVSISAGATTSTLFYMKDTTNNEWVTLSASATGRISISLNIAVGSPAAAATTTALVWSGSTQISLGTCTSYTITNQNSSGSAINVGANTTITLSGAGLGAYYTDSGCSSSTTTLTLNSGTSSKAVYYRGTVKENVQLTSTASGITTGSLLVGVDTTALTRLVLSGSSLITKGDCTAYQIVMTDNKGNSGPPPADRSVNLSVTGSGAIYSDSSCQTPVSSTTLVAGEQSKTVYMMDATKELITASVTDALAVLTEGSLNIKVSTVLSYKAGSEHTCVLVRDQVQCFGSNADGQLGDGTGMRSKTPVIPLGLERGVTALAAGSYHTCAIVGGAVKCWGANTFGKLGDGTGTSRSTPTQVTGLTSGVTAIAAGGQHTCAIVSGAVKCWGYNVSGQLGDGTITSRSTPTQVTGLTSGVTAITTGDNHTCAIVGGSAKCWGRNFNGQLGDGSSTARTTPTQATGLTSGVTAMATGSEHTCAVVSGAVKCWGMNIHGTLGDGTTISRPTPTQVTGLTSGVSLIAANNFNTCAVVGGGIKCWGWNYSGQVGDGTAIDRSSPTQVSGLNAVTVQALIMGSQHSCYHDEDETLKCWGNNSKDQLGDANELAVQSSSSPRQVVEFSSLVSSPAAGGTHTCAIVAGAAKCWGANTFGQLGDGTTTARTTPTQVIGLTSGVTAIATGDNHTCAVVNGGVQCWGFNFASQLGDGTTTNRSTPTQVTGLTSGVTAIATGERHTCAIVGGGVQCWGSNDWSQLGDGTNTTRSTPTQVTGLTSGVSSIATGGTHSCAIAGGAVLCWGSNEYAQVGNGTWADTTTPAQVPGLTSGGTAIAAGQYHTCAIVSGAVKCWGDNSRAQLGDGTWDLRDAPAQVTGLTSGATAITAGKTHTCAIVNDGAKCWGSNVNGKVGVFDDLELERETPTQVTGLTSGITSITAGNDHTCAVNTSGAMGCWGSNFYSQLGFGASGNAKTPLISGPLLP